ncbi:MAG: hypothetical protein WEC12_08850, partial [Balneolaceae bacterium]
ILRRRESLSKYKNQSADLVFPLHSGHAVIIRFRFISLFGAKPIAAPSQMVFPRYCGGTPAEKADREEKQRIYISR